MAAVTPNPLRDNVRRVADRISPTDMGVMIVIIDKDGIPTTYPFGLNFAGRFKALAASVATLAKEITNASVAKSLKSGATTIGNAANKLIG